MVAAVRGPIEWKACAPPRSDRDAAARYLRRSGASLSTTTGLSSAMGASLFWAGWGAANDLARLERNLTWLKAQRVDYVRAIAVVVRLAGATA